MATNEWIGLGAQTERWWEIAGLQVPRKGDLTDADTRLHFCYGAGPGPFWVRIRIVDVDIYIGR